MMQPDCVSHWNGKENQFKFETQNVSKIGKTAIPNRMKILECLHTDIAYAMYIYKYVCVYVVVYVLSTPTQQFPLVCLIHI